MRVAYVQGYADRMDSQKEHIVSDTSDGARLDKVLESFVDGKSLRLRRRLCNDGRVLVDGKARKPGYKVHTGQQIEIIAGSETMPGAELGVYVVDRNDSFAAVFKPGGVHSAAIAGRDTPCVEGVLPELFPDNDPILLNRLDYLTSGLLLVALTKEAVNEYHELEDNGYIRKYYCAEVHGRLDGVVSVRSALDTDDRKTTRVLDEESDDPFRWTDVTALSHDHEKDTTMVRCLIMKGARHQIRAHLASVDHPILGDPLYGSGDGENFLHLHHEKLELPGFFVQVSCPWGSGDL
ncbi:pseudouridine synthase [uncultured Pseudodesulfovibrio sp.]|uniref:pseudouridine synthase n=1 Tax=uncultured Pseudodesulfovibrio sp. TaxID=2035858 RepID=UPI0037495505